MTKYEPTDFTDSKHNCFESYWIHFFGFQVFVLSSHKGNWQTAKVSVPSYKLNDLDLRVEFKIPFVVMQDYYLLSHIPILNGNS
jgi:hypothetical protein